MNALGRILIVDDEPAILRACERTLSQMGYDVKSAAGGREALRQMAAQNFDFVLTDLAMPEPADGEKLTKEIARKWPSTDVVVMTGYPALETAIPVLKNGARDYLVKPIRPEILRSVVSRCFEKRRLLGELGGAGNLLRKLEASRAELEKVERLQKEALSSIGRELTGPVSAGLQTLESLSQLRPSLRKIKLYKLARIRLVELQELIENLLLFAGNRRLRPDQKSKIGDEFNENSPSAME
ncbi:MAG: response regulator [Elusimicrobia bacterium]|nr:response regulator [Elusimicrobiota bacterium]